MKTNLIDRYIAEIGKQLAVKNRADIQQEIRSTVEDMLTDRAKQAGVEADEAMLVEVLKEFGKPEAVAASYQPDRYLIGPKLYGSFLTSLQVVLPIVFILSVIQLLIGFGEMELTWKNILNAKVLGTVEIAGPMFSALGVITLIFAVLQRTLPEMKEKSREWDPRNLPEATPRNRIDTTGLVIEIIAASLALVLFNFFPQFVNIGYRGEGTWWIGFFSMVKDSSWSTPILSHAFFGYLPTLTVLWAVTILMDIGLLNRGRWETWSRWGLLFLKIGTIALACVMLAGPALVEINAGTLISAGFPNAQAARLIVTFAQLGTILALMVTIIASLVTALRLVVRLTGRNLPPALEKFAHP